jgi:hypothetical protein
MYRSIWPTIYHVSILIATRSQWKEESEHLEQVLDLGRKANVTDARDKIYGLLGLMPSKLSTKISPEYSDHHSEEEVFCEFAWTMPNEFKRLDFLTSRCAYRHNSTLPSWVPDWTTEFSRNLITSLKRRQESGSLPYWYGDESDLLSCASLSRFHH